MRNLFYFLAALLSFGVGWYYYQDVSTQTATVTKLRLVSADDMVVEAGTEIDDAFLDTMIVTQPIPRALAADFRWAMSDDPVTRANLKGLVFGEDVRAGSFLTRAHFFAQRDVAFDQRILPGNRAFSIPVDSDRGVGVFLEPGAHVDVYGPFVRDDDTIEIRTLIENAVIMAAGEFDRTTGARDADADTYSNVTLQAPAAAVEAFLAMEVLSVNELTLVLRNPCDGTAMECVGLGQ